MNELVGERILITGATGQVANPLAKSLASRNEVCAIARFGDGAIRQDLEDAGVATAVVDLSDPDFSKVPGDPTIVLHFARANVGVWETDLDMNVGGVLSLMEYAQGVRSFLHCSTTAVYEPNGPTPNFTESDALGDNHRLFAKASSPEIATYSIGKIAAEGAARWAARRFGVPTTIARINVPYGTGWSWPGFHLDLIVAGEPVPVHSDGRTEYNPIHDDDVFATLPGLVDAASIPVTTVNWGGVEVVSIEEWCSYFGELIGVEPTLEVTDATLQSVSVDTTRMESLVGPTKVAWRDGFRRIVEARHPELLASPPGRV